MTLNFTKMQACGNDFIVVDDRAEAWTDREPALARALCHRRYGVGADGLLLLRRGSATDRLAMVFVNADGLVGEMCGNGARCFAGWLRRAGLAGDRLPIETRAGVVEVIFEADDRIALTLPPASPVRRVGPIDIDGCHWWFDALDTGPPHAVCLLNDPDPRAALDRLEVASLGRTVRHHPLFAPRGTNVNFVAQVGDALWIRTYERGVEDETPGCGTGAVAAAIVVRRQAALGPRILIHTRSGDTLEAEVRDDARPRLIGSAQLIADGAVDRALLARTVGIRGA